MFGSIIAEFVIYNLLSSDPRVTGTVGNRIWNLDSTPPDEDDGSFPILLYVREFSGYSGPVQAVQADDINFENLSYSIRIICEGTSTIPIEEAALAQLDKLSGHEESVEYQGRNYTLNFTATGEAPLGSLREGPEFYRQLGTVYDIEVTRG